MSGIDGALADVSAALAPPPSGTAAPQGGNGIAWSWQDAPATTTPAPVSGVDAALADIGKSTDQLHAELGSAQKPGGLVSNFAAGANEMAANIIGAPVDAATWVLNKAHDYVTAPTLSDLVTGTRGPWITNPIGGSQSIQSAMGWIGADPRNIGVNNGADAAVRGAGGGAAAMVAPYLAGRALIAQDVGGLTGAAARLLGGSAPADAGLTSTAAGAASNAAVGAAGSLGGQTTETMLPADSPYRTLANAAGQLIVGGAVGGALAAGRSGLNAGTRLANDVIGPMMPSRIEEIAANRLAGASSDPVALARSLDTGNAEFVPSSLPTTFQASGDLGIGRLQASLPQTPFDARAAEQNAARVAALNNIASTGNASAVRDLLQQRLAQIDQAGDAAVQAAQQRAQAAYGAVGGQQAGQELGAAMRGQLEAAKAATKAQERSLWQSIDPDGSLAINAMPVRQAADQIMAQVPPTAAPVLGDEAGVFQATKLLGSATPFANYAALRSRLLDAIRTEAATNGQSQSWRRLQMLRGAMDSTMESAADGVAQQDAQAIAAGRMRPEDAIMARVSGWANDYVRQRDAAAQSGPAIGADLGGNVASGTGGLPAVRGASGQNGRGLGGVSLPPGTQGQAEPLTPASFDAAAAARYRAAADATRARAQTFKNPQVGPALQERGGMYRLSESQIPQRFISSPEGISAALNAGIDRGTLQNALIADLRQSATSPDGTLNQTKFANWSLRRNAALRAFPELQQTLGSAAQAQQAVDAATAQARQASLDYQRGAARHFLNAEPTQAVQSAMGGKNPVADMRSLAGMVAGDLDAKTGLQRAAAEWIAGKTIGAPTAGADIGQMRGAAFNNLVERNRALRQVFDPDQIAAINGIADDLRRGAQPLPKGGNGASSFLRSVVFGHGAAGIASVAGYLFGGFHGALEAFGGAEVAKKALDAMTRAGIERRDQLLTEVLLNPELAKTLLMKATPSNRPFIAQRLAGQLGALAGVAGTKAAAQPAPMARPAVRSQQPAPSTPRQAFVPGALVPGGVFGQAVR